MGIGRGEKKNYETSQGKGTIRRDFRWYSTQGFSLFLGKSTEPVDSSDEDSDEEKYADQADQVGQKVDAKSRVTVRNLRIREDTARYLLDLNAEYNPKKRALQDAQAIQDASEFVRESGDVSKMADLQAFAWEAEKRGNEVHINANPTMGELMFKQFQEKKKEMVEEHKTSILARYGGEEHLQAPPKELLLAPTEQYVEYSATGEIIQGQAKPVIRSKYPEDV